MYRKGEYKKALDYFSEDYKINGNSYSPDIQQNAAVNMAKAHLKLRDMEKTRHYLALTSVFRNPKSILSGYSSKSNRQNEIIMKYATNII